jgi:hypothetical protein
VTDKLEPDLILAALLAGEHLGEAGIHVQQLELLKALREGSQG